MLRQFACLLVVCLFFFRFLGWRGGGKRDYFPSLFAFEILRYSKSAMHVGQLSTHAIITIAGSKLY